MKIMIFLHGTILMQRNAVGRPREERVRQVVTRDQSIFDFATYVPVGNAVQKLRTWQEQGADIVYLSSRQTTEEIEVDASILKTHGFPAGPIFFRRPGEKYQDLAERVLPAILIEDDCESIGGEAQMTYPHIAPEFKSRIKSIVVKEFGGLDELPNSLRAGERLINGANPMTNQVQLRDVVADDLPIFFEQQLDPRATRLAAFPSRDRDAFMAHWAKILRDETVIVKAVLFNAQVAGNIAYFEESGQPLIGYWIGKEYWGKGIATRALSEFLNHVKTRPLYAYVAKHNIASRRVLEKCGFMLIGEDKAATDTPGEEVEEFLLKLA